MKISSRKLWTAIVGVLLGIAMVFGLDENTVSIVSGAVMALVSVVTYIITEGKIDAEAVKEAAQKAENALEELNNEDKSTGN